MIGKIRKELEEIRRIGVNDNSVNNKMDPNLKLNEYLYREEELRRRKWRELL